eukprot:5170987-Pleurochrysis_carterae.AAC.1
MCARTHVCARVCARACVRACVRTIRGGVAAAPRACLVGTPPSPAPRCVRRPTGRAAPARGGATRTRAEAPAPPRSAARRQTPAEARAIQEKGVGEMEAELEKGQRRERGGMGARQAWVKGLRKRAWRGMKRKGKQCMKGRTRSSALERNRREGGKP